MIYQKYSWEELFDQNDGDQTAGMANTLDQSKDLILSVSQKPRVAQLSLKAHQKMNIIVVEYVFQSFAERRKEITQSNEEGTIVNKRDSDNSAQCSNRKILNFQLNSF